MGRTMGLTVRHSAIPIALLLLVTLLAGCAEGGKTKKARDPDPFTQPTGFTDDTGSVMGRVVDEEFVPLKDAIVGFIDPYQATKTDESGYFEIGQLKPGQRNLYTIHIGHKAGGKRITLTAGQPTEVTFVLAVLPIEEPWIEVIHRIGYLNQSVKVDPVSTSATPPASHRWRLRDNPAVLEGVAMEVLWRQSQSLSGGLRVSLGLAGLGSRGYLFQLEGKSPLAASASRTNLTDLWKSTNSVCVKEPCRFEWTASPDTGTTNLPVDVGVMLDQSFDVYVSHFYRMPMPENYSVGA